MLQACDVLAIKQIAAEADNNCYDIKARLNLLISLIFLD